MEPYYTDDDITFDLINLQFQRLTILKFKTQYDEKQGIRLSKTIRNKVHELILDNSESNYFNLYYAISNELYYTKERLKYEDIPEELKELIDKFIERIKC